MADLYRAIQPGVEFIERADGPPKMRGRFTVYNRWTEIDSGFEGHFMERIMPGAFSKTIKENLAKVRVIFSHGKDPSIGYKPLGTIDALREESDGPNFEVTLLDADYVKPLIPGMKAGVYGASFHASIVKMDEDLHPDPSEINREGIPERTYTELRLKEFGPTPFPAIDGTEVMVRSLWDEVVFATLGANPEVIRKLLAEGAASLEREEPEPPEVTTPADVEPSHSTVTDDDKEERPSWLLTM